MIQALKLVRHVDIHAARRAPGVNPKIGLMYFLSNRLPMLSIAQHLQVLESVN
jgi:hypothetical protein